MLPAAIALLVTCVPPVVDCDGRPLLFPEQVSIVLPYMVRGMAMGPACPPDEFGQPQPCAAVVGTGEWPMPGCSLVIDTMPDPRVGEVFDVQMPVAVNPAGRSDGC